MNEITTRRALEVCLSRLPMTEHARDTLATHLAYEIRKASEPVERPLEALQADMQRILTEASGMDASWTKSALLGRLQSIREIVRGEA